jgi:hypothetical protein
MEKLHQGYESFHCGDGPLHPRSHSRLERLYREPDEVAEMVESKSRRESRIHSRT